MVAVALAGWAGGRVAPISVSIITSFPVCIFLCLSPGEVMEHMLFWLLVAGTELLKPLEFPKR